MLRPVFALVSLLAVACTLTAPCPPAADAGPPPCGGACQATQVCIENVCKYTCDASLDCARIDARLGYCSPEHVCDPPPPR